MFFYIFEHIYPICWDLNEPPQVILIEFQIDLNFYS